MTPTRRRAAALLAAFVLRPHAGGGARAAEVRPGAVAVVLSSELPAYREAWEGFREEFGPGATMHVLTDGAPGVPDQARVAVAFGGGAALARYPRKSFLIFALSPGLPKAAHPRAARVSMLPRPERLADELVRIQPGLKRLSALWASGSFDAYVRLLRRALRRRGVEVRERRLRGGHELPDALRAEEGESDALWLPPDPLLIDPSSFVTLRAFSEGRKLPLHTSLPGLVEKGASSSISPGYREAGRAAARAARLILAEETPPQVIFPDSCETILHPEAARLGLVGPGRGGGAP